MRTALHVRVSIQRQSQAQTIEHQLTRLPAHLEAQGQRLRPEWIFPHSTGFLRKCRSRLFSYGGGYRPCLHGRFSGNALNPS